LVGAAAGCGGAHGLYIVGVHGLPYGDGAWYGWYAVFWKQQFGLHMELHVVAHDGSQIVCLIGSLPGIL